MQSLKNIGKKTTGRLMLTRHPGYMFSDQEIDHWKSEPLSGPVADPKGLEPAFKWNDYSVSSTQWDQIISISWDI